MKRMNFNYHQNEKAKYKLHRINSCTQSFVGALTGICMDKGLIKSLDEPIGPYFEKYRGLAAYKEKEHITIRHLLSMSSGIDWPEFGEWDNFLPMYFSNDMIKFILSRPMTTKPGVCMNYSSGDTQLLGEIIAKVAGMPLDAFAKKELFDPMQITKYKWQSREGHTLAANGLQLMVCDLIKLGELYLAEGFYHKKTLLSKEWIQESFMTYFSTYEAIGSYGYHWWHTSFVINAELYKVHFALGYRGQFCVVIPKLKLVAASVSDMDHSMRPLSLLENMLEQGYS